MPLLASENLRMKDDILLVCSNHLSSEHIFFLCLNDHLYKDMNMLAFVSPQYLHFNLIIGKYLFQIR